MKTCVIPLLLVLAFTYGPSAVRGAYGWAQARTSLGRSLGEVKFEQPESIGQQQATDLRDGTENTPASMVRLWIDQDCNFEALLNGQSVYFKFGPLNGDFSVNSPNGFDEMLLTCTEDLPVYSAEEPPGTWTGTIPALEYGGFLPVGSGMMLPGYSGPFYGLAPRDDVNGDYGTPTGCFSGGSYQTSCAPGLWVTTQPATSCLLCTACVPLAEGHPLTCTQAPSTCTDITNVNGQIICNCAAAGDSCSSSQACCAGLTCHASGGPGASCYPPNRKLLGE